MLLLGPGLPRSPARAAQAAADSPVLERARQTGELRVCIWPEYHGITLRHPHTHELSGIDIELSAELARDLGLRARYVDSSFATLEDDVEAERCDVAMFAIGTLPQRMERLRFTRPYMKSGILAVATRSSRVVRGWQDIDRPGVLVAVQAGTFMETVVGAALREATLVSVRPPMTRERELEAGRVDVFMTDLPYGRRLASRVGWARLIAPPAPFHELPYAYAVRPGDEAWLGTVDGFVARIQRDGRLQAAARRHGLSDVIVRAR